MPEIATELEAPVELASHVEQQRRGCVADRTAGRALEMEMARIAVEQVIDGPAMADVDVLDNAEMGERLEGAVDAGAVDGGVAFGDDRDDLLGGEVSSVVGEDAEHRLTRAGHPLATGVQPVADVVEKERGRQVHRGLPRRTMVRSAAGRRDPTRVEGLALMP